MLCWPSFLIAKGRSHAYDQLIRAKLAQSSRFFIEKVKKNKKSRYFFSSFHSDRVNYLTNANHQLRIPFLWRPNMLCVHLSLHREDIEYAHWLVFCIYVLTKVSEFRYQSSLIKLFAFGKSHPFSLEPVKDSINRLLSLNHEIFYRLLPKRPEH
jgi:hypothetical protein